MNFGYYQSLFLQHGIAFFEEKGNDSPLTLTLSPGGRG
jgi:hypothetical protein